MRRFLVPLVAALALAAPAAAATNLPDVTKINGKVPPGTPTFAFKSEVLSRGRIGHGDETVVIRTTRLAGTRAPIHTHDHGGTTCVLQGQMTLYMQGHEPMTARAGQCYFMPRGHLMTGVNSGKRTAVMLDIFTVPIGAPTWTPREPGFRDQ